MLKLRTMNTSSILDTSSSSSSLDNNEVHVRSHSLHSVSLHTNQLTSEDCVVVHANETKYMVGSDEIKFNGFELKY